MQPTLGFGGLVIEPMGGVLPEKYYTIMAIVVILTDNAAILSEDCCNSDCLDIDMFKSSS